MTLFNNFIHEPKPEITTEEKVDFLYKKAIVDEIRRKRKIYYKIMFLLLIIWYTYYFLLVMLPSLTSDIMGGEGNSKISIESVKNLLKK